MLKAFYRYLYHRRQQQISRRRLAGKTRSHPKWHRFSYNVFQRANWSQDKAETRLRWLAWICGVPVAIFTVWFLWESVQAIGVFQ